MILATLSFRFMAEAELRTKYSLLDRFVIPGNGRADLLQTSASKASRRARSPRPGERTGILEFVVKRDCERLIGDTAPAVDGSFNKVVFFSITWHKEDLGPTVVARWIERRRATVPSPDMSVLG